MRPPADFPLRFQENGNALRRHFPAVAAWLESAPDAVPSSIPPQDHANLQTPSPGLNRYIVVYGLGDGGWLARLHEECHKRLYRLIVAEPSREKWMLALRASGLASALGDSRARFLGESWEAELKTILGADAAAIGIWSITSYLEPGRADQEQIELWKKTLRHYEDSAKINSRVQMENGFLIQQNIARNLPVIARSHRLDSFIDRFKNHPAVVVGAGPSLDKNIEDLRGSPKGCVIVAVDTALPALVKKGIHPHFVAACDPTELNMRHFSSIASLGRTVLAFLPETHHAILEKYRGHSALLYLHDANYKIVHKYFKATQSNHGFQRGMNVGFCAFSLARLMGCAPVALVGMDHALSADASSHADGTANQSSVFIDQTAKTARLEGKVQTAPEAIIDVPGYHGGMVATFPYFAAVLRRFAHTIAGLSIPVINATEGGAQIGGAMQMTLKEAMRTMPPAPEIHFQANPKQPREVPPEFLAVIQQVVSHLSEVETQLDSGLKRLEQWKRQLEDEEINHEAIQKQADTLEQRWNSILLDEHVNLGVDIALAQLRFETYRAEPPAGCQGKELGFWWQVRYAAWFAELKRLLQIFRIEYQNVLNTL